MKRLLFAIAVGLLLAAVQVNLLRFNPFVSFAGVKPDLLLILVIYIALWPRRVETGVLAFLFGALEDVFSSGLGGLFAFLRVSAWCITRLLSSRFFFDSALNRTVFIFLYSIFDGILMIVVLTIYGEGANLLPYLRNYILIYALFNAAAALVLWPLVRWGDRKISRVKEGARLDVRVGY